MTRKYRTLVESTGWAEDVKLIGTPREVDVWLTGLTVLVCQQPEMNPIVPGMRSVRQGLFIIPDAAGNRRIFSYHYDLAQDDESITLLAIQRDVQRERD